jgi:hypothetical protein
MSNYLNKDVQNATNNLVDAVAALYSRLQDLGESHQEIIDEIANAVDIAIEEAPGLILEWKAEANCGWKEQINSYGVDY